MMGSDSRRWETESPEATFALGRAIGQQVPGGTVLGLVGPLGAGKTLLVQGIAAGNGLDDDGRVTSPTFTLVNEYRGRLRVFHLDTYRLRNAGELLALGLEEMIRPDSVVLIEWADRVRTVLPDDAVWVTLRLVDENRREITISAAIGGVAPLPEWVGAVSVDTSVVRQGSSGRIE